MSIHNVNKASFLKKAISLANGEELPEGQLKGEWFEVMKADGVLSCRTQGSRRRWKAKDKTSWRNYIAQKFNIVDLEGALEATTSQEIRRADLVACASDSKFIRQRSFMGFLVNCYHPIEATLNGKPLRISPQAGTFTFIYDYEHFSIPEDVVVVGIENPENFRYIFEQREFFEENLQNANSLLFVSRYPQNQSADLIKWLRSIPNQYIHFGDLDLAGISIYLNEFYKHLGTRSSFLIPKDYKSRIEEGSLDRYNNQYQRFHNLNITDPRLKSLFECINTNRKGYDQEGFIGL